VVAAASDGATGVYGITVAAELAGVSVQALRLYERKGLLVPARTVGGTRRYSDFDVARLRRIRQLIDNGVNLTGIAHVLGLEADNTTVRDRNDNLRTDNRALRAQNTQLTTDNRALRAANAELQSANAALAADHASQDQSRHPQAPARRPRIRRATRSDTAID
jgi:MerR family transcriptional regulator/heat shock protein HspR